jgi:hypothetical protein
MAQLKALASCGGQAPAAVEGEEPAAEQMISDHPVDKLAAWLLSQADLSGL